MGQLHNYRAVLFDLDGTLSDPLVGIANSMVYTFARLEQPMLDSATLRTWVGPPLRDSFARLLGEERADAAVALYREHYGPIGAYENLVYPGIPALLEDLRTAGLRLFVATSKLQLFAERILAHFELAHHFSYIGGTTADGRIPDKGAVIGSVLPHLSEAERASCVMVGDREHDIFGAREHGLPCIGVSWGYGSPEELQAAGALAVAKNVAELRSLL
jgi:phosphoglycolate phosphatase